MGKKLTLAKRILKAVDYYDEANGATARTIAKKVGCSYARALTVLKILGDLELIERGRKRNESGMYTRFEYWKRKR